MLNPSLYLHPPSHLLSPSLSLFFSLLPPPIPNTYTHRFSAVVRQEVAPPPPAETTPFRPNGGTPSINSDVESVAPPPAAATVGVNSIPKTDTSSAGGSNSGKELLSDAQPVSGDSSTGLVSDTPTLTTSEDSKSTDSAIKEVAEVKGLDVTTGSGEVTSDKVGIDK